MHNNYKKFLYTFCLMVEVLVLFGCGGGSSSTSPSSNLNNSSSASIPTVKMIAPDNGSANISVSTNIQLQFSEAVANVNTATLTLHESSPNGPLVSTSDPILGADNIYTFTPINNKLNKNTQYFVVVGNGITSVAGGKEVEAVNFNFTTGIDNAPTVSIVSPANNSTEVSISQIIQLSFSESVTNVNLNTVTLYHNSASGPVLVPISIFSGENNSYRISPNVLLDYSTPYYVVLGSGITSVEGNIPLMPTKFTFTTLAKGSTPTVTMIKPLNNQVIESFIPEIKIQFSEPVNGINRNNFLLRKGGINNTAIWTQGIIAESNNVYKLILDGPLDGNATYYVTIERGINSVSNNIPVEPTNFSFSINGPFAYVVNENGGFACRIMDASESGGLGSCKLTAATNVSKIMVNPSKNFAYVLRENYNTVSVCAINESDSTFNSCRNTGNGFDKPTGIAFTSDNKFAYITNDSSLDKNEYYSSVSRCSVVESSGELISCNKTGGEMIFYDLTSIAVDSINKLAYITSLVSQNAVNVCNISESSGELYDCGVVESGITPNGAVINNDNLYTTDITKALNCLIDEGSYGKLTCDNATNSAYINLVDISLNNINNVMYLADSESETIFACHQNESGEFNNCSAALKKQKGLSGITILSN